jgi:hypothetical protein
MGGVVVLYNHDRRKPLRFFPETRDASAMKFAVDADLPLYFCTQARSTWLNARVPIFCRRA